MRILFSGVPAHGHLLPLLPLARAALDAGHDAALLTSGGMAPVLAEELPGLPVIAAGPMPDALFAEVARRMPGSDPAGDPTPDSVAEFFAGARIDLGGDEAIEAARAWRPDLLVCDAADFVGPLAAAALDVPWNLLAFGPALPDDFSAPMRDRAARAMTERGLRPVPPEHYLDPCPPVLQVPGWRAPVPRLPVRPETHRRPSPGASPWQPSDATRVVVTFGTVFSDARLLERVVDDLDAGRYEVVATVGVLPGAPMPEDRPHVRFVGFQPLEELLDDVRVVVCAAGAGTVLGALSRGVPIVAVPQGADQFINAERAQAAGAAITVTDAAEVASAVARALEDPRVADAAATAAAQIAALPAPAEVIAQLAGSRAR